MADKDIKINIKTSADTSGAAAAEAAIKQVTAAAEDSAAADNPMLRGKSERDERVAAELAAADAIAAQAAAMAKAAEASKELETGLGQVKEELQGITEASEEANEQGGELDENVSNIARAQKAQALANLAGEVGKIAGKFREAADEVRAYDSEAADALDATADRIENVTGAVSALALGFAVGGPLGAGLAATGLLVGALVNSFQEAEVAAIKASAAEKKAHQETAEAARKSAADARDRADALSSTAALDSINAQNAALAEGLSITERLVAAERRRRQETERILQSEDKLKLARIDEQEAKGEVPPEQARTQRAEVEQGAVERRRAEEKKQADDAAALADAKAKEAEGTAGTAAQMAAVKQKEAEAAAARAEQARKSAEDVKRRDVLNAAEDKIIGLRYDKIPNLADVGIGSGMTTPTQLQEAVNERNRARAESDKITTRNSPALTSDAADKLAEDARKKAVEKEEEAAKAAADAANAKKQADAAREEAARTAMASRDTSATVDTVAGNEDAARAASERARLARQAADQKAKDDADAERRNKEERRAIDGEGKGLGRRAGDLAKGVGDERIAGDVKTATDALRDGASGAELNDLGAALRELGGAAVSATAAQKASINQLIKDVRNLAERVKRVEGK